MNDVTVNKSNGGLGRTATTNDMISALIVTGVAVGGGAQLLTTYVFLQLSDAEALGLDAAYDLTNHVLVHYHISEVFRKNPSCKLYFRMVAQSNTLTSMVTKTNPTLAKALLIAGNGAIEQLGVVHNPASGYTPTLTGGFDGDVLTAIVAAQALCDDEALLHRPLLVVLEGKQLNGAVGSVTDLHTLAAPNVAVVIGQDLDVAAKDALFHTHACVGTALGCISLAKVNEDIGWVGKFPLTDTSVGAWVNPGLSSNMSLNAYSDADLNTLGGDIANDIPGCAVIFPRKIANALGVFFNDSPTCTESTDDYAYIENNRTINKAITLVRNALLPFINSPIQVDPTAGTITAPVCKNFEKLALNALNSMVQNQECSGVDAYVNPAQNILSTSKLQVNVSITPTGTARLIVINIGFNNPFNA